MFHWFGVKGLAAGMAIAYTFGSLVQGRSLSRRIGGIDGAHILRSAVRIGLASAGMGLGVWLASELMQEVVSASSLIGQVLHVGIPVAVGVVLYLGLAILFRVEELADGEGHRGPKIQAIGHNEPIIVIWDGFTATNAG